MDINWYPGHMAKTRRMMQDSLKTVEVVLEVLDARVPAASRNPDFEDLFSHKKRLILLNKADLAEETATRDWVRWYAGRDVAALGVSAAAAATRGRVLAQLEKLTQEKTQRLLAQRGIHKTVRVMVVGIPNTGKSTLINCLARGAAARAADMPGVTRGKQNVRITPYLELLDTPGMLWPKLDNEVYARHLAFTGAIRDEVLDPYRLCLLLLSEMAPRYGGRLAARYKLDAGAVGTLEPEALLERICLNRGLIKAGGMADEERGVAMIFNEFRGGKLGRLTLEHAPEAADD